MLQTIRDRLTGPTTWVIIGIIAVPFAFFGLDAFQTSGGDPQVAKVGTEEITESQVKNAYDSRLAQYQAQFGDQFRSDMIDPARLRAGIIKELVDEAALRQHAKSRHYTASDAAILEGIRAVPAFQADGQFSADVYKKMLSRQGLSPAGFEQMQRDGMAVGQLRDAVLSSSFVTDAEKFAQWQLNRQQRTFSTAVLRAADYAAPEKVTEADIGKFYSANGTKFQALERIKLQYVELSLAGLPPAAAPDNESLKALYDAEKARFNKPEARRASHILIAFGADKAAAEKSAAAVKAKLDAGADFAALAAEFSQDTDTRATGGDLGFKQQGDSSPKFDAALFAAAAPGVIGPVETEFGYEIINVTEIRAAASKPFDDPSVQTQLRTAFNQKDAEVRFQDLSTQLDDLSFENNGALEPVAKKLGLTIQTTDWISRNGSSGIGANPAVQAAAFSPEVMKDGENSKPISIGENHLVVVRKAEFVPSRPLKLDEVREVIRADLVAVAARKAAEAKADALLLAAKAAGADFAALAAGANAATANFALVSRTAESVDAAVLAQAFKLPKPKEGAVTLGKAVLANGDVTIVRLESVTAPMAVANDPEFMKEAGTLSERASYEEFIAFREALKKSLKVKLVAATKPDDETP